MNVDKKDVAEKMTNKLTHRFDTIKTYRRLLVAGFSHKQSKELTNILFDVIFDGIKKENLTTKIIDDSVVTTLKEEFNINDLL